MEPKRHPAIPTLTQKQVPFLTGHAVEPTRTIAKSKVVQPLDRPCKRKRRSVAFTGLKRDIAAACIKQFIDHG